MDKTWKFQFELRKKKFFLTYKIAEQHIEVDGQRYINPILKLVFPGNGTENIASFSLPPSSMGFLPLKEASYHRDMFESNA